MKTLAQELWAIGLAANRQLLAEVQDPEMCDPGLSSEDVDNYAQEYARTLNKAQNLLGYRPYDVAPGDNF